MGRVAAKVLASQGARLLLVGRNSHRCEAVKAECIAEGENQQVECVAADLSSVREVRRAAPEINRRLERIDTLVINAAGAFPWQRTETEEGLELVFVLQYLQRYVLTQELLNQLRASEDPALWEKTEKLLTGLAAGGGTP